MLRRTALAACIGILPQAAPIETVSSLSVCRIEIDAPAGQCPRSPASVPGPQS